MRSLERWVGVLILGAILCAAPTVQAKDEGPASGTEWWYVLRARANMKIGNYRAAIESYEKAAELNPDNREALKQLGVANEKQGLTAKAIESWDRYLARFDDDPDVAFKQADLLGWERYAYRRADAIRYYRMGLAKKEDLARRHKLARLLAQDRSQLEPALVEYRKLLKAKPDEATWRAEYRDLLLWDPGHLDEAIAEYRRFEKERPGDFEIQRRLAELIAREDPRSEEAAERYAALVARRPQDAKLRLAYAEVLGADPRKRDRAIAAYREAVAQDPRPAVRETFADMLSSTKTGRTEALAQYDLLLRENPGDVDVRLKRAHLLAARREDTQAAIAEYDRVLAREPRNAAAHAGLAEAYAWLGDRDQALHHSNLSLRYGQSASQSARLRGDLMRGRERFAGPVVRGLFQEGGSKTELRGVVVGARARTDVGPFVSVDVQTGFEDYFRSGDDAVPLATGVDLDGRNQPAGYLDIDGEYRLNPSQKLELGLGYHSLTGSADDVLGRAAFASEGDSVSWKVGFERKLRFDSYTALVGEDVGGRSVGAAREHRFFGHLERPGDVFTAMIEPYVGWIGARGISENPFVGLRGELRARLFDAGVVSFSPFYRAEVLHYRDDAFGLDPTQKDPAAGGYFSPQLYVEQVPGLRIDGHWGAAHELTLEGGPAAQFVKDAGGSIRFELGGHARLAYVLSLSDAISWTLETRFTRIGDAYTRGEATTSLRFAF